MAAPMMLFLSRTFIFLLFFILCLKNAHALINFEELKSSVYDIDIWDKPLLYDESKIEDGVILSSKLGQQYQCLYNDALSPPDENPETATAKKNVSTLLKPIEEGNCLKNSFGWWTYEFCYRQDIKQYHMENGELVDSSVSILGLYSSDFDWSNSEKVKTSEELVGQYHSQSYVNGTLCDLTGRARLTTVRFRCNFERGEVDQIVSLEEPATCEYILTISTSRICQLEYIKVLPARKSIPITCQPLLPASEFEEYTLEQKIKEELLKADEAASGSKEDSSSLQNWEKWLTKMKSSSLIIVGMAGGGSIDNIVTSIHEALGSDGETSPPKLTDSVEVQIVNSVADLAQVLEEFQKDVEVGLEETQQAIDAAITAADTKAESGDSTNIDADSITKSSTTTEPIDAVKRSTLEASADKQLSSLSKEDPNLNNLNDDAFIPDSPQNEKDLFPNPKEVVDDSALINQDDAPRIDSTVQTSDELIPSSDDTSVESSFTSVAAVNPSDTLPSDGANIPPVNHLALAREEVPPTVDQTTVVSSPVPAEVTDDNPSVEDTPQIPNEESTFPSDVPLEASSSSTAEVVDSSSSTAEVVEPIKTLDLSATEAADNPAVSPLLKQISLLKTKILEIKAREQAAQDASGQPARKLEVKVINADYYDKDGKAVSRRPERRVMAIFQNNDNEIQAYAKNRQLENSYNFKWTGTKSSKDKKKT